MGIKHNYQSGTANSGTAEVSSTRWNEEHVISGVLPVPAVSAATPAADNVNIRGYKKAGKVLFGTIDPFGCETALQAHLGGNAVSIYKAIGSSTTVGTIIGMVAPTATGTANARTQAATSIATRMARIGYLSAATAGQAAGIREALVKYTNGNGVGVGGFFARFRFTPSDAANVSNALMFVGFTTTTGAFTVTQNPAALTNCVGVAQLSGSSNLQIVYGGAAAQTPIDLGTNFPANTASLHAYELLLFAAPTGDIYYEVKNLVSGNKATGTLAAASCPAASTFMCWQIWRSNNATAAAVGIDICSVYIETDN